MQAAKCSKELQTKRKKGEKQDEKEEEEAGPAKMTSHSIKLEVVS